MKISISSFHKFSIPLFAACIFIVAFIMGSRGYLSPVDHAVYDTFMNIRQKQINAPPANDVLLVTIDQASEEHLDMRISNFTRSMLAKAIDNLSAAGADTIGVDLDLSKRTDPADDTAFASAVKNSGKVVLASYVAGGRLVQPLDNFLSGARGEGLINLKIDRDGVLRSTYVVFNTDKGFYLGLPLLMASQYKNNDAPKVRVQNNIVSINNVPIPVRRGVMLINYAYAPDVRIRSIPYYKVLDGSYNHEDVKGKIVLIGNTSPLYHDYYSIPLKDGSGKKTLYGVEVYASVINTVLGKAFITYTFGSLVVLFMGIVTVFLALLIGIINKPVPKVGSVIAMIASAAVGQWMLFVHGFFMPGSQFYLSIPLIAFYSIAYDYMTEYRAHRYVSKAFEHYVSKELLDEIRSNPESLKLGGEKKEITVLFSDIRDFTSISEGVSPERLVEFLHVFFNTMTGVIYTHHGVVDKFIGDAIMALFGAPISDVQHAINAVSAASGMIDAMGDLKKRAKDILGREINIGIGIHTGEAIVGNMGSDKRFDYTAIGDTVNLASRLEGLNKFFGTTCIISDEVRQKLNDHVPLRQLGRVKVKGKTEGVKLYEIMAGADDDFIRQYNEIWQYIYSNDLKQAGLLLKKLHEQKLDDKMGTILLEQIDMAVSSGKPFDPVIEMKEK